MTDSNILFIVFGFIFFCIVLSNLTQESEQMTTFEQRTKKYYDACDAVNTAYALSHEAATEQEKAIIMGQIKELIKKRGNEYCRLSSQDQLQTLSNVADSLEQTADMLKETEQRLKASNQRLKESNNKLRISVEKMKQRSRKLNK